ncbi:MAG: hypothetical protein GFH27_549303n58 [Chloroflexi bacterium AL-W]|nr:hypothetical protein [Chloroflexi bacterium AL-N1]NOK67943.1 hypothetical protein [Chloroflexi bacterium AL-N10]NOK73283.1 hypothetical protein [Chloroflexi bacterium AL-N5]NOK83197.1 hypothetical protein [Chloroflexi bacterium AL-W]NOK87614.1 hypothetical protein [Chloroflexi bacterium AL-N15]
MVDLPYKIQVPQRPAELVSRVRLLQDLQKRVQCRLVALVAPAGYGKTSLLIDFVHTEQLTVCWYSLDTFDTDPWEFIRYLAAAIQYQFPDTLNQTQTLLDGSGQPSFQTVVTTLVREINSLSQTIILCFDDWHCVDQVEEIRNLVGHITTRCPNSRVILTSRMHPSLPNQMLLAARRQFVSFDETHLRFLPDELRQVLSQEEYHLTATEHVEQLVTQSDGWITGVLLALQANSGNVSQVVEYSIASNRSVRHFLMEQVFDQQPSDVREVLCETALLEEISEEQCLTILQRTDVWHILEKLLAQHLFINEIKPGILRYAPFFQEFLQQRLRTDNVERFRAIGHRMAEMAIQSEQWSVAFDVYSRLGDWKAFEALLSAHGDHLYARGRLETLEYIFALLPHDPTHPRLLCLQAKMVLERGDVDQAQTLINQAEQQSGQVDPYITIQQAILDNVAGRYDLAAQRAQRVLIMEDATELRSTALRILGISQYRLGKTFDALKTLQQAYDLATQEGNLVLRAQVTHQQMLCYQESGDLYHTERVGYEAEALWAMVGNLGRRALTQNGLVFNYMLQGRYQYAYILICSVLQDAHDAGTTHYEAAALSTLGDIYAALGCWDFAFLVYCSVSELPASAHIQSLVFIAQVRVRIEQQQYQLAAKLIQQQQVTLTPQHTTDLLLLQAKLAGIDGDYEAGLKLAEAALAEYSARGFVLQQIRAWVAIIWLYDRAISSHDGDIKNALQTIIQLREQLSADAAVVITLRMIESVLVPFETSFPIITRWLQDLRSLSDVADSLEQRLLPNIPSLDALRHMMIQSDQQADTLPDTHPTLRLQYLGNDQVWVNNQPFSLGSGRPRETLAYLVLHPRSVSRAELYQALWGEDEPSSDANILSRIIYRLRNALPHNVIVTQNRDSYYLDRTVIRVISDVDLFEKRCQSLWEGTLVIDDVQALQETLEMYRGPLLESIESPWCVELRTRLERQYHQLMRSIAEIYEAQQQYQKALEYFHQLIIADATHIAANAGIMRCHVALGEPALAVAQYRGLVSAMDEELGMSLDPESEPEQIYQRLLEN